MSRIKTWLRRLLWAGLLVVALFYLAAGCCLVAMRWVDPPTTMVQIERRWDAIRHHQSYKKRYEFVPLRRISPEIQHAVIAAEDGRFFQHHGFDWLEMQKVLEEDSKRGKLGRGASTITQQLVKNLFLTTERSLIRKGVEASLVPIAEKTLGKQRILELYLNVIEWGPGIYGAQAAAENYYHVPASAVNREQAARLAAVIPSPLRWKPAWMNDYSAEILERMSRMGW